MKGKKLLIKIIAIVMILTTISCLAVSAFAAAKVAANDTVVTASETDATDTDATDTDAEQTFSTFFLVGYSESPLKTVPTGRRHVTFSPSLTSHSQTLS